MLEIVDQQAGLGVALIIAVGLSLLAGLLLKPKKQSETRNNDPTTATERGAFIPLIIGTREVGAVVLWVGRRRTAIEGEDDGKEGSTEQTIFFEKAVHALCVGPAAYLRGIFVGGKLIPGSTEINSITHPSGTAITFTDFGTCRIYWGTLDHDQSGALLSDRLGVATGGPYVMRVEWDDFRLGTSPIWKEIKYIVEVPPMQSGPVASGQVINRSVNYGQAFWQLSTGVFPHGGGIPTNWIDFQAITDMGTISAAESVGCNLLIQNGDFLDTIIGEMMQDFGFLLPECSGVLAPYVIRKVEEAVQSLDNDLLLPPIDEIERVHLTQLGDALVYQYKDRDQNFKNGTIDVDDDSVGAIRNQRKTKTIDMPTVTIRGVASAIANRRQIEDLAETVSIKAKGMRGLRAAQAGQPFDLPGVGRVRLMSYKLNWNDPTVELELLQDSFDQAITEFVDPALPGEVLEGDLENDIRFAAFEVPFPASPGSQNALAVFRHRDNASIFTANIWVSNDGITYFNYGPQSMPCAGGLLASNWAPPSWVSVIEEGPLVNIDANGDEILPTNLSGVLLQWLQGSQIMLIGSGRDAEMFFIREWTEVVAGVSYRPMGLVRGRFGAGYSPLHWDRGNYKEHSTGDPCFIITRSDISPIIGDLVTTGGGRFIKSQPINSVGAIPVAAITADDIAPVLTPMSIPSRLSWVACGGTWPVPRRDLRFFAEDQVDPVGAAPFYEDIVFEVIPSDPLEGAGYQGYGQPVSLTAITGSLRVEVYFPSDPGTPDEAFEDLVLASTHEIAFTSLTEVSGVYRWNYTDTMLRDDEVLGGFLAVRENWRDDDSDGFHWKFLLYHVIEGVASPPVEVRPASMTVTDYSWIPRTEQ